MTVAFTGHFCGADGSTDEDDAAHLRWLDHLATLGFLRTQADLATIHDGRREEL